MNVLWLTSMVAALFKGFCVGRLAVAGNEDGKEAAPENEPGSRHTKERQTLGEGAAGSVGSPVSGEVEDMCGGERPTVVIRPSEDRIYAPAGGKITKLFPMGNAFLFNTEFGAELYIQAGDCGDELLGRYFRPRIVQNEIVGKGKLLLEFDRRGLEAEGASPRVSVAVETGEYGSDILAAAGEQVKSGEEILRVHSENRHFD